MNLNDRSPVTQPQITVSVLFELYSPSYSGRSGGVHFLRSFFCMNYSFTVTRLLNHLHHFWIFDGVTNTDYFHCQTPLKNAKFELFNSENASWQIWLQMEIGCDSPMGTACKIQYDSLGLLMGGETACLTALYLLILLLTRSKWD